MREWADDDGGLVEGMSSRRALVALLMAAVVALPLLAVPANAASSQVSWTRAKVVRWIDGDTVRTTKGTIRIIGVDTAERGRCGYSKATRIATRTAPKGTVVRLGNPRSVDDRDRYQRKLRYVVKGKTDIAAKQIRQGLEGPLRLPRRLRLAPQAGPLPDAGPPPRRLPLRHEQSRACALQSVAGQGEPAWPGYRLR